MDTIYRNALSVLVWLGLPSSAEMFKHHHEPIRTLDDEEFDWFLSIREPANRPYWGRFWVIQEFLLGRNVNIYRGNSRLNRDDFKDLLGIQTEDLDYLQSSFDYTQHESDRHPELQQPLYKLLINHRNSQCKDPRDRVFALLGLVTINERHWLGRFFPDYTMSEDDVIIIALSHVQQINLEYDGGDTEQLFMGLGVNCKGRRKRLSRRAEKFDYFGDLPPSRFY
ncbi:hypothetical protein K458DRAFT_469541, partial [Lentithecium fluviatile CBS 122367]